MFLFYYTWHLLPVCYISSLSHKPPSVMNNRLTETPSSSSSDDKLNQIVKFEIEAAEVLAGLAHSSSSSLIEVHTHTSDSPKLIVADSMDLAQKQSPPEQKHEELCRNEKVKTVKAENSELQTSPMCRKSCGSLFNIKSRQQNLSEGDQEERRIRRILANRESARQTIRRRQAVCDELNRKTVDLSSENATLKKEKQLAEKEYASLRSMNSYLKEQMVVPMHLNQVNNSLEKASPHVNTEASSTNPSLLLCNASQFSPFVWPSIIKSASSLQLPKEHMLSTIIQLPDPEQVQHNPQNTIIFSPRAVNVTGNADSSHQQASPSNFNPSATPICLLPCQWLFSRADPSIGDEVYHHPSLLKRRQDETTTNITNEGCSTLHSLSHIQSGKESRPTYNLNEPPGDGADGAVQEEANSNGIFFKPAIPSSVFPTQRATQQNGISPGLISNGFVPSTNYHSGSLLPIRNGAPLVYSNKTPVEVDAAAEARKRRKEVTRLKNLRPFRINC